MPRYAAFLRAVSPENARMPQLQKCFEAAGFTAVKTIRSSGNVVFNARTQSCASLQKKAESAMCEQLGSAFFTIVRSVDALQAMIDSDPYAAFKIPSGGKRVVTFLHKEPQTRVKLHVELDGARILCLKGMEVFSVYVPGPRGPVFMRLIEKTFGRDVTTRTWDTVKKCVG